jgi:hypothetical protein
MAFCPCECATDSIRVSSISGSAEGVVRKSILLFLGLSVFVHSLFNLFLFSVRFLYTLLFDVYSPYVYSLFTHWSLFVYSLFTLCLHSVYSVLTLCLHSVTLCSLFVQPLFTLCSHSVHSFFSLSLKSLFTLSSPSVQSLTLSSPLSPLSDLNHTLFTTVLLCFPLLILFIILYVLDIPCFILVHFCPLSFTLCFSVCSHLLLILSASFYPFIQPSFILF